MRTKNLRRVLLLFAVVALAICMAQTAVFAENTVSISNGVYENGSITVTGSINAKGAYMNILAIRTDNQNVQVSDYATNEELSEAIVFIDQVTADTDNFEKTWTFPVKDTVSGNYVVVFVSGTNASVQRLAIPLDGTTPPPVYENGTFALVPYTGGRSYYLAGTQEPAFTLTGDDAWKEQLDIKVYWQTVEERATIDKTAGTITMAVPQTVTTYTIKANNTSDNYPAFSQETTFKYVSAAGAEFAALPADLGVTVDKSDDSKYSFVVPANTSNVTFTATVDGVAVDGKSFDVEKGDEAKTVVITATAPQTLSKSYTVTVPAREASGEPAVSADAVTIIKEDGAVITNAYKKYIGTGHMIVTIDAADIDPDAQNVTVGGVEFYYVAKCNYFVGIVPVYADEAAIADAAVIADGASDLIEYGKDPIDGELGERIDNGDYIAVKKIALGKVNAPTDKQLLSADVADGVMDGLID
ncbi:MAG: hypothetical protein J5590_03230, partial [Clostridia bacterium]|nr:hypothetical protein [Clostridia bacterium]